jgi:16S rRNA (uracil1498-N3)-methyltransferase
MRRFFISPDQLKHAPPFIDGADAHHLRVVLRLQPGGTITVLDGQGQEYQARILSMDRERVYLALEGAVPNATESSVEIIMAQGYLKDKKMDALIRPLTELGVSRWIPFLAARSVPAPDPKRLSARQERWRKLSLEAVKQCGRGRAMHIDPVVPFEEALKQAQQCDLRLIFWEKCAVSRSGTLARPGKPSKLFILIGPEGGFETDEVTRAQQEGFLAVGMGPRILRAQTAALTAAVIGQFVFGDLGQNFLDKKQVVL